MVALPIYNSICQTRGQRGQILSTEVTFLHMLYGSQARSETAFLLYPDTTSAACFATTMIVNLTLSALTASGTFLGNHPQASPGLVFAESIFLEHTHTHNESLLWDLS